MKDCKLSQTVVITKIHRAWEPAEVTECSPHSQEVVGSSPSCTKGTKVVLVVSSVSNERIKRGLFGPMSVTCDLVVYLCVVSVSRCISVGSTLKTTKIVSNAASRDIYRPSICIPDIILLYYTLRGLLWLCG